MFSKSLDIPNVSRFCPSRSPRTVTRLEIHLKVGYSVACHKSGRPYSQLKYNTGFSAVQAPSILGTFGMHPKRNPGYANRARAAHCLPRERFRQRLSRGAGRSNATPPPRVAPQRSWASSPPRTSVATPVRMRTRMQGRAQLSRAPPPRRDELSALLLALCSLRLPLARDCDYCSSRSSCGPS